MTAVVFSDIDPILLIRTVAGPDAITIADMIAKALASAAATEAAGVDLLAAQQMPILVAASPKEGAVPGGAVEMIAYPTPMPPPESPEPPQNTAVPYVSQSGSVLSCTVGEWTSVPTTYAYAWQINGSAVGTSAANYAVQPADVGGTATCIVTATNAAGSTAAPPSVGIVVV